MRGSGSWIPIAENIGSGIRIKTIADPQHSKKVDNLLYLLGGCGRWGWWGTEPAPSGQLRPVVPLSGLPLHQAHPLQRRQAGLSLFRMFSDVLGGIPKCGSVHQIVLEMCRYRYCTYLSEQFLTCTVPYSLLLIPVPGTY